jgi:ATP-dependent Clp protease protease subunit
MTNNNKYRKGQVVLPKISKDRTLYLFDEITSQTAYELIENLVEMDKDRKKRKITLYLCSPGGECGAGFAIVDIIRRMKCPVKAIAIGEICSMAPAIFVACEERVISENSFVMLHPVSTYSSDYVSFAKSRLKQAEDVEKLYDNFFLTRTRIPKKVYRACKNSELWLTANEAIKYNIAQRLL